MIARLRRWLSPPPVVEDGFGQSLLDDLRYRHRFRRCRRRTIAWRRPTRAEAAHWDGHPLVGRFGDATVAVAVADGRDWIARENDWHGWPDPKRYPFFVMADDTVWATTEFDRWPAAWGEPPG